MYGVYSRGAERALDRALGRAAQEDGPRAVVGSETIVLAVLEGPSDPEDPARRALDAHGVTAGAFDAWRRRKLLRNMPEKAERAGTQVDAPSTSLPFVPEANLCLRRALQLALEEQERVGTKHLLLGVLYERDSVASVGLSEWGVTYEVARQTMESEQGGGSSADVGPRVLIPDPPQRTTRGAAVLPELARQVAEEDPSLDGRLATHHYLLALAMEGEIGDPGGLAGRVLRSFGLSYPVLLDRIRELGAQEEGGLGSDDPSLVSEPPDWPIIVDDPF